MRDTLETAFTRIEARPTGPYRGPGVEPPATSPGCSFPPHLRRELRRKETVKLVVRKCERLGLADMCKPVMQLRCQGFLCTSALPLHHLQRLG